MPRQRRNPETETETRITDEDVNAAVRVIRMDYQQDVRELADSLREEVKRGEIDDVDELNERIEQDVDGSARVIYTLQNKLGLLASDNEDAWEEMGFENPTEQQRMYCAMVEDVREELGDLEELFEEEEEDEDDEG